MFAPATVSVHRRAPEGSVRNVVSGRIEAIAPQAHLVRIHVGPLAADVTPELCAPCNSTWVIRCSWPSKPPRWRCIRRSSAAG